MEALRATNRPSGETAAGTRPEILLLQGPIGPFFRRLQRELEREGASVTRVLFNAGDELYGPRRNRIRFTGGAGEWEAWLRDRLARTPPDMIVYFGCKRPAHRIAARLAQEFGIEAFSIEEGYIRPGYITCERLGNNDLSPLKGLLPPPGAQFGPSTRLRLGSSFVAVCWWGMTYYLWRSWFSKASDRPLFHRQVLGPWKDTVYWVKRSLKTIFMRFPEYPAIRRLRKRFAKNYFLVPLQTPGDSQMREAARGWTLERLIEGVLDSFARKRSVGMVVFKFHPLDGDTRERRAFIMRTAARLGVAERVLALHSGSIARLCIDSDGMIIVNSTSGVSAIHHGVPLLMLGDGVFRNGELVMCGDGEESIDDFFDRRRVAPADLRRSYLRFLRDNAMVPGDFYKLKGIRIGARKLARRLLDRG